jgi:hypothetical protein
MHRDYSLTTLLTRTEVLFSEKVCSTYFSRNPPTKTDPRGDLGPKWPLA